VLTCIGISVNKSKDREVTILPDDTVYVGEPSFVRPFNSEDEDADASTNVGDDVTPVSSPDIGIEGVLDHSVETGD